MYYVPFIYWGREGDKKKNVLCTFHIPRLRGWQEEERIMYLSYTEVERVTRRRMYYVPFIYWDWEGDKKKNVLSPFHILRERGWQEEICIMYLSFTGGERLTRTRMYYVPFIYWGWEGDKNKNVLCIFHILRVRGWQEQQCIMYLSYTEGDRVTRTRMYYVPFIYWGWEGYKKKNVLCAFHILRVRGWEGDKNKNVLCTCHIPRLRGWQEEECIMYLSYTEIERVTRRRMYYVPFIYWGREGDKKKNVLCTIRILSVRRLQEEECIKYLSYTLRGWQEEECIMYLSYTEGERVTRRRMYYVPFIYRGWEGGKNKNVLCIFHILRVRGWQEQQCIMYLSYTEGDRVTRTRMYYVPFIYWGWEGYKKKNVLCAFHILRVRGWEGDKNKNVLCTCHLPRLRGWQEEECIMYLSYTEIERVTRRRMYYVPFIYWGREGDKKKNVLCTIRILSVLQEEECIKYLSYT